MSLDGDGQREKNIRWAAMGERNSRSIFAGLLFRLYAIRKLRGRIVHYLKKSEGGEFFSQTLREILVHYHDVTVGKYSYGCFHPASLPPGTVVGNYCSIASHLSVLRRNHPYTRLSQHPFFYNRDLGLVDADTINHPRDNPLVVGNDVWIGERVIILPGCHKIGNGAIVGAGAILTHDVEPFTIVAGNPARKIADRCTDQLKIELAALNWWEMSIEDLLERDFPFDEDITSELIDRLKSNSRSQDP